ncbi:hypothetical protein [Achromobacter insolitus]|uniref:hypothetical protein n=1 Tax=Achromobacter insolitus TaxID=217204 RepID=UPI00367332FE
MKKKIYIEGRGHVGDYESVGEAGSPEDLRAVQARLSELGFPPPPPQPLAIQIMGQAFGFAQSARLNFVRISGQPGPDGAPIRDRNAFAPFVVNAALALELYLKALAEAHGTRIKRLHELDRLYRALPDAARRRVEHEVKAALLIQPIEGFREVVDAFTAMRSSFVEWRYLYEREETDLFPVQGANMLMRILHNLCYEALVASPSAIGETTARIAPKLAPATFQR